MTKQFLDRLKAKNLKVCNIIIRLLEEEVTKYGPQTAILIHMAEKNIPIEAVPKVAVILERPNAVDSMRIWRVMWRKDGQAFAPGFLDRDLTTKLGVKPVLFHDYIQGADNERQRIITA